MNAAESFQLANGSLEPSGVRANVQLHHLVGSDSAGVRDARLDVKGIGGCDSWSRNLDSTVFKRGVGHPVTEWVQRIGADVDVIRVVAKLGVDGLIELVVFSKIISASRPARVRVVVVEGNLADRFRKGDGKLAGR